MNNKKKGGKGKKQDHGEDKKAGGTGAGQNKEKMLAENPAAGLANIQNELMSKISAMKESLMKGEGGEGLGKEMIDNLFKNLLGDFNMPSSNVDKNLYLESEPAHQEFCSEIDTILESIWRLTSEIDTAYSKVIKVDLQDFPVIEEKEPEYHLTAIEEIQYEKELK